MQIGKPPYNPGRKRNLTKEQRRAIWDRLAKKYLKQKGYLKSKKPLEWYWAQGDQDGFVLAFTRGEARSKIKEVLGISKNKRLPAEIFIMRVPEDG